jgi:hypothetical protein
MWLYTTDQLEPDTLAENTVPDDPTPAAALKPSTRKRAGVAAAGNRDMAGNLRAGPRYGPGYPRFPKYVTLNKTQVAAKTRLLLAYLDEHGTAGLTEYEARITRELAGRPPGSAAGSPLAISLAPARPPQKPDEPLARAPQRAKPQPPQKRPPDNAARTRLRPLRHIQRHRSRRPRNNPAFPEHFSVWRDGNPSSANN